MISPEIQRRLLSLMLKIRKAEEKIVEVYAKERQIRTPTHLSIGQEAVAAGLCAALNPDDQIFTGHRCHAAYLARGGAFYPFFAELCGRVDGSCAGRAGSAHLSEPALGMYASPILGAMIPVAVGAGLSFQMDRTRQVAAALFGDAAIEEGVFAESLNFAVTKKLPVLFVCENNLYSTHSPLSVRQPPSPIYERIKNPELKTRQIDGNDAALVYQTISETLEEIRSGSGPQFIECLTYRIREHVGPLFDYDRGYRSRDEVESWIKLCPVESFRRRLIDEEIAGETEIFQEEQRWQDEADRAYAQALESPWPAAGELLRNVD